MENELKHHGVLGMKWGIRRYQPYDTTGPRKGGKTGKEIGEAREVQPREDRANNSNTSFNNVVNVHTNDSTVSKGKDVFGKIAKGVVITAIAAGTIAAGTSILKNSGALQKSVSIITKANAHANPKDLFSRSATGSNISDAKSKDLIKLLKYKSQKYHKNVKDHKNLFGGRLAAYRFQNNAKMWQDKRFYKDLFEQKYGRAPTNKELTNIYRNLDSQYEMLRTYSSNYVKTSRK